MSHIEVKSGNCKWMFHQKLAQNLDYVKEYGDKDWDFKMLISGDGMTRTGKTTIAFQSAQYVDPTFADDWKRRVIFDGRKLIKNAYEIGKGKSIVYDEAREGLDNKKQMEAYTKNLLDFFSQCGNLNHKIFLVLPEFFDLPKGLALTQSIFLINCYARDQFKRGYFDFFSRIDKKYLYIKGTKYLDYKSQRPSFKGTFTKYFPINQKIYEKDKIEALKAIRNKEKMSDIKNRAETHRIRCKILIKKLMDMEHKSLEIAELLGTSKATIFNTYLKERRVKS